LDLVDILFGDLRAEFVVRTNAVALNAGLTNQYTVFFRDVLQSHEIGFRGVDRDSRSNDVRTGFGVIFEEFVHDLAAGLSEADHCEFHILSPLAIAKSTIGKRI